MRLNKLYENSRSEDDELCAVFAWAAMLEGVYPCLELMYHTPNEGKRTAASGGRLKAKGLKKGVPDIALPCARGGYHGLYIELKVGDGKPTAEQKKYLHALDVEGYFVALAYSAAEAIRLIERYVRGEERA